MTTTDYWKCKRGHFNSPGCDVCPACGEARWLQSLGPAVEHEAELHEEIRQYCQKQGWLFFEGAMCKATHRTPGEMDFDILMDDGISLRVECKSKTGKPSESQQAVIAWAQKLGHRIHVVRNMDEFKAAVGFEEFKASGEEP